MSLADLNYKINFDTPASTWLSLPPHTWNEV